MSHPAWYTRHMIMTDTLFEVRVATWSDGTTTTAHIKAFNLAHAKRIAKRKWGTTRVQHALTVTERFKEVNR